MFADVVITVDDGKEFKAHKNILASRSPVFAMFEHTDTKYAQDGRIEIEYVQSDVFEQFLQYLYTGKATSLEQYTEELLTIAEKYQVDSLKSVCIQQLCSTLTTESLGKLLHLADLYRSDELKGKCVQFIKYYSKDINFEQLKYTIDCSFEFLFEKFHLSLT